MLVSVFLIAYKYRDSDLFFALRCFSPANQRGFCAVHAHSERQHMAGRPLDRYANCPASIFKQNLLQCQQPEATDLVLLHTAVRLINMCKAVYMQCTWNWSYTPLAV